MLEKAHEGHLGVAKSKARAREHMWWPGMSRANDDMIVRCEVCAQFRHQQRKEPLMSTQLPDRSWQQLGSDLFEYRGKHYLLIADFRKSVSSTTRAQLLSSLLAVTSLRVMVFPNDSLVITDHNTLARSFEYLLVSTDLIMPPPHLDIL